MKYEVFITQQAEKDLRDIYDYIANELRSKQSALNQINRLEEAIMSLDEMPERYIRYSKEPWESLNLRVMPVDNYLVFYIPDIKEKNVKVMRIMYGRRDIDRQL